MQRLEEFGLSASDISYDPKKVVARSRAVAKQLSNGVAYLLKKNKVTVFDGEAKLAGKGKLAVAKDGKPVADLAAQHIVLATGARARSLPGLEPDGKLVWTYKEAMVPEAIPKSLLVVGSGAIGDRIRQLLPRHGRRGDGRRGARPRVAGRGRGDLRLRPQELREAGHQDPYRRDGERSRIAAATA